MLNYLIDSCIEITKATSGSIMLIDPVSCVLDIKVIRGLNKGIITKVKLKVGEGVTGRVAETGKPLLINNVDSVDFYVRIREDLRSELAVPLIVSNRVIGVLSVDCNRQEAFTEEDLTLLQLIGNIVVQILNKENIINTLKNKIEFQKLLIQIAGILDQPIRLEQAFQKIMDRLSRTISLQRGMLILLTAENKLRVFQGYRLSEEAVKRGIYEIGEGITGKTVKTGEPIIIRNISENREFLNKMKIKRSKTEIFSFYSIPIRHRNKVAGVLAIEKQFLDDEDLNHTKDTLILIAAMITQKIESYERTEKEKQELISRNRELSERLGFSKGNILIGRSEILRKILETADLIADTDATVLITGSTGTGKEVLARRIHYSGSRATKPFISINCAAIPAALLESELFGYKKGAFTNAVSDKKGKFILAHTGTVFLDEIGDLDFNLQAKLLRVIQEKTVEPLGGEFSHKVDIRIITATNKNLELLVKENKFREDLFYRINLINLHLPNLNERKEDIPLLVNYFLEKYTRKYAKPMPEIPPPFLETLMEYSWPGNIRELENVIERSVILSAEAVLDYRTLSDKIAKSEPREFSLDSLVQDEILKLGGGEIYPRLISHIEKVLIDYALIKFDQNQSDAADWLGIHRNTLRNKIQSLGITES
ncbi:MAG: sigma 54-interacting transcriptional regulator [bacterium]|nr:sigma 54-interacting transcriptional regulator [bacterium]